MKEKLLYIWFQMAVGRCSRTAGILLSRFSDITSIYRCEDFSFLQTAKPTTIKRLENKDTSEAFEVLKKCQGIKAEIIGYYDDNYPASLRKIETPPAVLYAIGEIRDLNNHPCVAIVGTRKMSEYGREVAENFAYNLAKSGAYIISGLAKGVDTAAHRGAFRADGYTVGVLGNPIGEIYPRENEAAFEALYKKGLVLSELYPGAPRTSGDFPNRNRIISALSDSVVIAEAGEGSGALITAGFAVTQGKRVYAIPGAIGAKNAGTNTLIKTGTPPATSYLDVLEPLLLEYPENISVYESASTVNLHSYGCKIEPTPQTAVKPKQENTQPKPKEINANATPSERIKFALGEYKMLTTDELCAKTGLSSTEIMIELTFMEIDGSVVAMAGGRYSLSN